MPYFDVPVGRGKIQTTSKNSQRYYTTKRLIRDLLSNTPNFYVRAGEISRIFIYGECVTEVREAERIWRGIHSFFYKNIFYKNIEAEICEILRIF